jgi:hypothetical protein
MAGHLRQQGPAQSVSRPHYQVEAGADSVTTTQPQFHDDRRDELSSSYLYSFCGN